MPFHTTCTNLVIQHMYLSIIERSFLSMNQTLRLNILSKLSKLFGKERILKHLK